MLKNTDTLKQNLDQRYPETPVACIPVKYSRTTRFPSFNFSWYMQAVGTSRAGNLNDQLWRKMIATKASSWVYEDEIRIIKPLFLKDNTSEILDSEGCISESGRLLAYQPEALKQVIFGEQMDIEKRSRIIKYCHSSTKFFTASMATDEYKIIIKPLNIL